MRSTNHYVTSFKFSGNCSYLEKNDRLYMNIAQKLLFTKSERAVTS